MMNGRNLPSADEFVKALAAHAPDFGVELDGDTITRLCEYERVLRAWNARLHLVAPCTPEEFATRHVLESLLALSYLETGARLIDVGAGAGLPSIPCLAARTDLRATLVESSPKKAVFLREALRQTGAHERATVVAARFEQTTALEAEAVACRALDRFTEMFPALLAWSPPASTLLLFGGEAIREQVARARLDYVPVHVPGSERRFLFVVKRG